MEPYHLAAKFDRLAEQHVLSLNRDSLARLHEVELEARGVRRVLPAKRPFRALKNA